MNNPAAKTREDVSTDLNVAGFDERKSRAIVQAVVDTTASLGLATHKDIDALKTELKADIAALKATVDKTHLWIRWGLVLGLGWLSVLIMALGWLANNN